MSQPLASSIEQDTDVTTSLDVNSTASSASKSDTLRNAVTTTVKEYFLKLDGAILSNFYELFITEIELPLLEVVLQYTGKNQSIAAKLLNISRGTLRKKMAQYGLLKGKK